MTESQWLFVQLSKEDRSTTDLLAMIESIKLQLILYACQVL